MTLRSAAERLLCLEAVLSMSNDAITVIDRNEVVLYWNDVAEQFYNIPRAQILGKQIRHFFQAEHLMVLRMLKTSHPVRDLYHRPRPDTHVLINASPVYNKQGELLGAVSVERNISRLVKLNEELIETSTQLDELKHALNQEHYEDPFAKIKGSTAQLQHVLQLAHKVAKTDATVLITGESGVGKELFARAIHQTSNRAQHPFVPVNCGAIPSTLFESELFGYEKGAFTGAVHEGKPGKVEMADGGTLFLDEIAELTLDMQVKLLRFLQEQEVYRIGATHPRNVDVRIIAATNRVLEQRVAEGSFREDLFYRLNVVSLNIPALRERKEDIPQLTDIFLREFALKYRKSIPVLDPAVLATFTQYSWPGNIRQLRNVLERLVILNEREQISLADLPPALTENRTESVLSITEGNETKSGYEAPVQATETSQPPTASSVSNSGVSLHEEKDALERERILETLRKVNGNKSAAAKQLGISRATLYHKLKKYVKQER